jgi:CRISPR-associated protein Cmr4
MLITKPCILHALTPLHAGVGQAADLIDLPVARLTGTGIPFLPGSSAKGVLRAAASGTLEPETLYAVFGPETTADEKFAGAIICQDARLLALPVRSFKGTFAFATSPLLLTLASYDLPSPPPVPWIEQGALVAADTLLRQDDMVYLEDLDLAANTGDTAFNEWMTLLSPLFGEPPEAQRFFGRRFAIIDDATMDFFWTTATQLDRRVKINPATRTAEDKGLWLEESLPRETLLISLLQAEPSRNPRISMTAEQVLESVLKEERTLQFGGKATVGRGRCRMIPL